MDCQNCKTEIDYRFLTNCAACDCAVEPPAPGEVEAVPVSPPIEGPKRLNWKKRLLNLVHLFIAATSGLLFGTVVVYLLAAGFFLVLYSFIEPNPNPSVRCAQGSAIGFFSLVIGAFLGTVGGSFYSARHPLYKRPG